MFIMITDETNVKPSADIKFFVYGGLILSIDAVTELHDSIEKLRAKFGYQREDILKFDTNARPSRISVDAATEIKRAIVEECLRLNCKFIVHVIHHEIIKNQDFQRQVLWAADYIIGRYNKFLDDNNQYGMCVIDNLPDHHEFKYLKDKFVKGLVLESKQVVLDRICLFCSSCINASHVMSAVDIVLGAFRYCINNPKNSDAASSMMHNVVKLMWHTKEGEDTYNVGGKGLILRPENISVPKYKTDYEELLKHINRLIA